MKIIEKPDLDLNCPTCSENFKVDQPTVGESILCPSCNDPLIMSDEGYVGDSQFEEPDTQLDELTKNVDKL